MEIDITAFIFRFADNMASLSSSVAESGRENIGSITWRNACEAMADETKWLTSDLDGLRDHFRGYGAWDREELDDMSGAELNALLAQFISGDYQVRARAEERGELDEWEANCGGRLFVSNEPTSEGQWFYYIGD